MVYLIVKFLILFLLATLLGFLLGRWWVRRQFVDVSESFVSLQRAADAAQNAPWGDVFARFDAIEPTVRGTIKQELDAQPDIHIPEVDLSGITAKLNSVEGRFASIPTVDLSGIDERLDRVEQKFADIPQPEAVDLAPTNNRINAVEAALKAFPRPKDPEPVDFTPIDKRLTELSTAVGSIPQPKEPEPVDLAPVNDRLNEIAASIRAFPQQIPQPRETDLSGVNDKIDALSAAIAAMPKPKDPEAVDLAPVQARIRELESAIKAIPRPQPAKEPDFTPVNSRLASVESSIARLPGGPDMAPVEKRLSSIEERLRLLLERKPEPAPAAKPLISTPPARPAPAPVRKEPRLLKAASYGTKDDLKRISGVGPMLEDLLNKHGVYYFWQVADWSASDIQVMDDRLEVFKGRIERDNWVNQATRLKSEPGAAQKPRD